MGFFNDLGSLLGEAQDIKNDISSTVQDAASSIQETAAEITTLSDDITEVVSESIATIRTTDDNDNSA